MSTTTTNFAFILPAVNSATDEDLWGGYLNTNWTATDGFLKTARDRIKRTIIRFGAHETCTLHLLSGFSISHSS